MKLIIVFLLLLTTCAFSQTPPNAQFTVNQNAVCLGTAIQLTNVITTDNDGINDVFSYQYDIFKSFDIVIVNRWGNTISQKASETGTVFWDGKTNKGEPVADGVYFYLFEGTLFNGIKLKKDGFIHVVNNK